MRFYQLSKIDRWFLQQFKELEEMETTIDLEILNEPQKLRVIKSQGFSDAMIAKVINRKAGVNLTENDIYSARKKHNDRYISMMRLILALQSLKL